MIRNSRAVQIYIIVLSIIVSYCLAITAKNINSLGLGGLFNFFFTSFIGVNYNYTLFILISINQI